MDDFATLLRRPVLAVAPLDPGYTGHACDVWRVETNTGPAVVRRSRQSPPGQGSFFAGLHRLFGVRPWDPESVAAAHAALAPLAPVPRVIAVREPYLAVEHLPGERPSTFKNLGTVLGDALGAIHSRIDRWRGHPSGSPNDALGTFHGRLATVMSDLASLDGDQALQRHLPEALSAAAQLPDPDCAALVMADLDPSQVLVADVAVVIAPPALDLVGLEYLLDAADAAAFVRGYTRHRALPDLAAVRTVYRCWLYLIGFAGRADCFAWQAQPPLFH